MREITPKELQIVLANETGILANHYRSMLSTVEAELLCIQDLLNQSTGELVSAMRRVDGLLTLIRSLRPVSKES